MIFFCLASSYCGRSTIPYFWCNCIIQQFQWLSGQIWQSCIILEYDHSAERRSQTMKRCLTPAEIYSRHVSCVKGTYIVLHVATALTTCMIWLMKNKVTDDFVYGISIKMLIQINHDLFLTCLRFILGKDAYVIMNYSKAT